MNNNTIEIKINKSTATPKAKNILTSVELYLMKNIQLKLNDEQKSDLLEVIRDNLLQYNFVIEEK